MDSLKRLTTFQKVQLCSSVVPYYSTFFVLIVTIVELKKKRSSWIGWFCLFLIIAITLFIYAGISTVLSYDEFPIGNTVAALIIFAIANTGLVFLQLFSHKFTALNNRHNYLMIAIIFVCTILFVAVGVIIYQQISAPSHIEDINGSDNHLAIITMEEINATRNAGIATMGGDGGHGNKSMVDGDYAIYDYDSYDLKYKKVSGIFTLQATKIERDTLTISADSILTAGNAEILVFVDNQYHAHIPTGQGQQIVLENISGKTVVVKLAAESAALELSISRS